VDFLYLKHLSQGHTKNEVLQDLMVEYGQDVWNFAYSLTRRPSIADDIRQEVFVKAFHRLESYRGQSTVKTWLLAITRNSVTDYHRSAFFRKVMLVDYIKETGESPSAEQQYLDRQKIDDAWKAVMSLPVKLREVIVLYVHHELPLVEIARMLKISEVAAKVRLYRARIKVNETFNESEGDMHGEL
jgi:RNA polymerase sigma-70 factor (ECF subfamily)